MRKMNKLIIAILATDGFEEIELSKPREALEEAGVFTYLVSPKKEAVKSWNHTDWGKEYQVDVNLEDAESENYDGLLLPGGVLNPDQLRMNTKAIRFIDNFFSDSKPVAAICHGPQLLIETGEIKGVELTSYPSIRTDLENAGAKWTDEEAVIDRDRKLITSRTPDDIPAFNKNMIEVFREYSSKNRRTTEDNR